MRSDYFSQLVTFAEVYNALQRFTTHMLQNPTDSTELVSSSSFDPLALPPSTENDPTTFTHTCTHNTKNTQNGS